jgi:aquaporin TIP
MDYDPLRRGFAEFVGTFALVFIGAGSILTLGAGLNFARFPGPAGPLFTLVAVALAHGLTIAVMASAVGHISGGHFNPAITLGFLLTRRLAPVLGLVYWLAQISAAALAALLLRWLYDAPTRDSVKLGAPALSNPPGLHVTHWQGFVIEIVLTFFLVWVVFATAADPGGAFKSIAGLAIGLTITLDILMGGPLTGAAMNPARAFGPELVQNTWKDAWVWYAGPFAGGALAAILYAWLYLRPVRPLPVGPPETGVIEPRPGEAAVS